MYMEIEVGSVHFRLGLLVLKNTWVNVFPGFLYAGVPSKDMSFIIKIGLFIKTYGAFTTEGQKNEALQNGIVTRK